MAGEKIMVAEEDSEIQEVIRIYLEKNNFRVIVAKNGDEAVSIAAKEQPDLAILDTLLPGRNGFEVCQEIREISSAPILFLSCIRDEMHKITAFNMGGDDYISKPFSPNELIARVKARLRRPYLIRNQGDVPPSKLKIGSIEIDRLSRIVKVNEEEITLSRKEFELLSFLATRPEQTITYEQLFREIWGQESFNDTRTIIVHMSNLRKKVEPDHSTPRYIINVHGVGYKLCKNS